MELLERNNKAVCPLPEISAYVDGELSADDEIDLEFHLAGCGVCTNDLNLQKSFLNALDSSLDETENIQLPKNFTKAVVASAETSVSGLRRPHERRNAAIICAALMIFSFFALGSNADKTLAGMVAIFDKILAVVVSLGHVVYDLALGSAIVFRSLASKFVFESGAAVLFTLVLFVVSLYLVSRLLVRFHRT
jgi:anti-sigma factor RsiW